MLVKHFKAARVKKLAVKIKGTKLFINGEPYSAEPISEHEEETAETGLPQNPKKEREAISDLRPIQYLRRYDKYLMISRSS